MILLVFGPPGCGKGTQASFLAGRFQIPAISTGEMIRSECEAGTVLGRMASSIVSSGGLVSDETVNDIVASRISRPDCADGFLLDGYPRTVSQAMYLMDLLRQRGLPEPVVIHLDVPDRVVVDRLPSRRQCPKCKHMYNLLTQPPRRAGVCDTDGAPLLTRDDDTEPVILRRLRAYNEQTEPILTWFGPSMVRAVDGSLAPDAVSKAVADVCDAALPGCVCRESR